MRVLFFNPWLRKQAFNVPHVMKTSCSRYFKSHIFFLMRFIYSVCQRPNIFSLYCNCRDLKIRVQIRLPLTDVPPHTACSLDIIIKEQNRYYPATSFLMTFVLQLQSPLNYFHCLKRSTCFQVF